MICLGWLPVSQHQQQDGTCRASETCWPVQVATEWLFSVPEAVLEKHLGSDPNTPTAEGDSTDDSRRSYAPRRSTLNVSRTAVQRLCQLPAALQALYQ